MRIIRGCFRLMIGLLILEAAFTIHEYGHLKEFQENGIPVKEFSLGIGWPVYQYQAKDFVVSFRAIPIVAYVFPTKEGEELIKNKLSFWNKVVIYSAGVRNNIVIGLMIVLCLQVLGWSRGNFSVLELAQIMLYTPVKFTFRYFAFMINFVTLGLVRLGHKFCLSTGEINPPERLKQFIRWNLALGLFNLAPFQPLDGGRLAQEIFPLFINNQKMIAVLEWPFWFLLLFVIAGRDPVILQVDLQE